MPHTRRPSPDDIAHATVELTRELVACQSVTPDDGGCLAIVSSRLAACGFGCERVDRNGVRNLWARLGKGEPLLCLAGHVDVVPPGPLHRWTSDPFVPVERDGYLFGRGTADMKASVASMVTAAERLAADWPHAIASLAVLLTSDEEGDGTDGTVAVVDTLIARGQSIEACILGEPTSSERLGDTIKNGRRGSLNGVLQVKGVQCHIAYPERGSNPVATALPALAELLAVEWDRGNAHFPPTSFQISNVHAGTGANNVIPGTLDVLFNFRFSPASSAETLIRRVEEVLNRHRVDYDLRWTLSGEPFMTTRGPLVGALSSAIERIAGQRPALSTSGGISDGRFLARVARQVVEFGPSNESIHKVDECVRVADIPLLSAIYEETIRLLLPQARS